MTGNSNNGWTTQDVSLCGIFAVPGFASIPFALVLLVGMRVSVLTCRFIECVNVCVSLVTCVLFDLLLTVRAWCHTHAGGSHLFPRIMREL